MDNPTKTTSFRISRTDVILYDYEPGKGKIIISNDDFDFNLSYYWGSMGEGYDLSKFLQKVSIGYFISKLGKRNESGEIDLKSTMTAVRKFIKEDTSWKWYYSIESDKELRRELNEIQKYSYDDNDFVRRMSDIDISYQGDRMYKHDFEMAIKSITCEPWHFIVRYKPPVNQWLSKFHPILVEFLKNKGGNK